MTFSQCIKPMDFQSIVFEFQRNMVIMTNSAVNLPAHLQNGTAVSFDPTKTYTPLIDIEVDGKKTGGVINFDMGSAGTLQLGRYYFKEKTSWPIFLTARIPLAIILSDCMAAVL